MQRLTALAAVLLSLFVVTASASAQSAQDGYGGKQNVQSDVLAEVGTVDEATPASQSTPSTGDGDTDPNTAAGGSSPEGQATEATQVASGALPFTGFDAALMLIGGLALLATGLGVRRLSAPRS